ncbi:MAG: hypothetical protein ACRD0S_01605 [Acidimicrobiales bacterium]
MFVLPGRVVEMPGWLRLSLTASDAMVERAIPASGPPSTPFWSE